MKYHTLIFDLDGAISDPSKGIFQSINFALASLGYDRINEDIVSRFIGPPIDWTFRTLIPNPDEARIALLVSNYRKRYSKVGYSENRLYDGIVDALTTLKSKGCSLGVCTSKRTDFAEKILEMFCLLDLFGFIEGGDVGISKSDQLGSLLERKVIEHQSIMIGDRSIDVEAAKLNHLDSAGVLWGFGDRNEIVNAKPNLIIEKPVDLETSFGSF